MIGTSKEAQTLSHSWYINSSINSNSRTQLG